MAHDADRIDLHVYIHHEHPDRVPETLDQILHAVADLATFTRKRFMTVTAQIQQFSDRVNAATNEIAADLKALRDKVAAGTPLTDDDKALLDAAATRLEAMGVDPENPV